MKPYQKFIAGAAVLGTLAGCTGYSSVGIFSGGLEKTMVGVPISVKLCTGDVNILSTSLKIKDGKYAIYSAIAPTNRSIMLTDAYVLIETAIKERKPIKVEWHAMQSNSFYMDYVSANGLKIDLRIR